MEFKVGDKVKFKEGKERFISQKQGVITGISSDGYLRFEGDKTGWYEAFYELDMENKKNKTANTINTYFRDKNGNKEGQAKALMVDQKIVIRYHFCDARYDKFIKNFPMNEFRGDFSVIPFRHRDNFYNFADRAGRYFRQAKGFNWVGDIKNDKLEVNIVSENEEEVTFGLIIPKKYYNKKLIFRYDY